MEISNNIINQIQSIIANAQARAIRSVDTERVAMYWQIGKVIFEEEQQGKERAEYGKFLIKSISNEFQAQLGSGFTVRQLREVYTVLQAIPNCVCTADAIQLDTLHNLLKY